MIKKILYPLKYLTLREEIENDNNNDRFVIISIDGLWVFFCVCCTLILSFFHVDFFSKDGVVSNLSVFTSTLIGFYITALGVVATFGGNNTSLDDYITTKQGKIYVKDNCNGQLYLTRRRYVCLMFGYLSFLAIIFYLTSIFIIYFSPLVKYYLASSFCFYIIVKSLVIIYLFSIFIHMILTSLIGIYYLTYKIHVMKPDFVNKNED